MALLFVRALENEISKCKIKNFSKFWINLVDEAFSASFVQFLSKFIVQDDYCLFYSSISYAQFTGTRMWCTELHFVTHVSHALVILFTILQMNWVSWPIVIDVGASWDDCITYFENVVWWLGGRVNNDLIFFNKVLETL